MKVAGGRGVPPRGFYDKVGNETDGIQGHEVVARDPRERFMDHPDATPEDFNVGIDLGGQAPPAPPTGQ